MFTSTPASVLLALTPDTQAQDANVSVFGRLFDRLSNQN